MMVPSGAQILILSTSRTSSCSATWRSKRSTAPASPSARPRGTAGSATEWARTSVVARASLIASWLAARPLSTQVPTAMSTPVRTPATRNWATGLRTMRTDAPPRASGAQDRARRPGRRSDPHDAAADLAAARVAGPEDDGVGAAQVDHAPLDLEGAARAAGGGPAASGHRAVVPEDPAPVLTVAVAVHLALDLETAV